MENKMTDGLACLLTSVGLTQYENKILFFLSLISTILGLIIMLTKNVIFPLVNKIRSKDLKAEDIVDALEETKRIGEEIAKDIADDGQLNGSNKV